MPRDIKDLCFSISGQRLTQRSALYEQLKLLLPETFPERKFAFLGNPFERLPYPLLWGDIEKNLHPTTKLLKCWTRLNEFCCAKLRPALERGDIIVTDGFGLDALLYSTACHACDIANDEAFRLHSGLVTARLAAQDIGAPEYFITQADVATVDRALLRVPQMRGVSERVRMEFIQHEERILDTYFDGKSVLHQKKPNRIDASLTVAAMANEAAAIIGQRISEHRLASVQQAAD